MATIIRRLAAVIAGMIVAFVFVIAVELVSAVVHPVPPDFQGTQEEMCRHVERYPAWVLALVVPAWGGKLNNRQHAGRRAGVVNKNDQVDGAIGPQAQPRDARSDYRQC